MEIHKYENGKKVKSHIIGIGTCPKELRGIGNHPSEFLLNSLGWYLVEEKPDTPGINYIWSSNNPAYTLEKNKSIPQGKWIKNKTEIEILQNDKEKMDAFINFINYLSEIANKYDLIFSEFSFQEIMSVIEEAKLDDIVALKIGQQLRTYWDIIVYQYDSMQQAYNGLFVALSILN